jgi:acyl-CoA thioester hydrolase
MSRRRPDHAIALERKVGFQECDPLGVVWHGHYFAWMEAARGELFTSRGLDVPDLVALRHKLFVVDARCRYMAPLAYGDRARIHAWFSATSPLLRVTYDIEDVSTGRWCARALTVLAICDADGELLQSLPRVVLDRLPRVEPLRDEPAD